MVSLEHPGLVAAFVTRMGDERGKENDVEARLAPCRVPSLRLTRGLTRDRSRFRIPDWLRQSPSARPLPCRCAPAPSRGAQGRAVPVPASSDRTRGNDTGTEPAGFPKGK
jgi:hypothetical protein